MSRSRTRSSKKKTVTIAVLVACLLLAAIGGTIAWLTVHDNLTNQFTVGNFGDPTTNPDPENPGKGDDDDEIDDDDKTNGSLSGHLYEPSWSSTGDHKILPGGTYDKDPYVGMKATSEDAYVYIYIKNNAPIQDKLYFLLNDGWEAVTSSDKINDDYEAKATTVETDDPEGATNELEDSNGAKYYSSGLFKYTAGLTGKNATTTDVWTTAPLFSDLLVKHDANDTDLMPANETKNSVEVHAFMHQVNKDNNGGTISEEEVLDWINTQIKTINTPSEP